MEEFRTEEFPPPRKAVQVAGAGSFVAEDEPVRALFDALDFVAELLVEVHKNGAAIIVH